jgi:hypothetical protein
MQVKAKQVKVTSRGVIVKAAVCLVMVGKKACVHSAMLSNVSMWSAGQRAAAAKKQGQTMLYEAVELSIPRSFVLKMAEAVNKPVKRRVRKAFSWYLD